MGSAMGAAAGSMGGGMAMGEALGGKKKKGGGLMDKAMGALGGEGGGEGGGGGEADFNIHAATGGPYAATPANVSGAASSAGSHMQDVGPAMANVSSTSKLRKKAQGNGLG